jgi:hypothetical protein
MSDKKDLKPVDFSQAAVKKAVVWDTIEHPVVLYPTVMSVLGGASLWLFGLNPLLIAVAAGGVGVAFLSWLINYGFRRNAFANAYVKKLYDQMEEQRRLRKHHLKTALAEVKSIEGESQFKRLSQKFSTFESILKQKLNPGELTYGRYLGMAEQVYLGAIDNLQHVANTLKTVEVIDVDYINLRMKELNKIATLSNENRKELDALGERLALFKKQHEKVQTLLAQNEEAMTKIDITIAAIADMRTGDETASMDIETAMNELQRLAGRAKDYSNN